MAEGVENVQLAGRQVKWGASISLGVFGPVPDSGAPAGAVAEGCSAHPQAGRVKVGYLLTASTIGMAHAAAAALEAAQRTTKESFRVGVVAEP